MHTKTHQMSSQSKRREDKAELDTFFDRHIDLLKKDPRDFETGERIHRPSRLHIAHLLPKRTYKSVAVQDENVVYLTWQNHSTFDNLLDRHKFSELEKRFPKTWKKLLKVLPLATEQGNLKLKIEEWLTN